MFTAMIRAALSNRLLVMVIAFVLLGFGVRAAMKLSVDAFPDVTNIQVQIATEAPGRSPEEVERFVTVPLEIAMTGLPGLTEMRALNRSGLLPYASVYGFDEAHPKAVYERAAENFAPSTSSAAAVSDEGGE